MCIAFAPIFTVLSTRTESGVGMWDAAFWRVFLASITFALLFTLKRQSIRPTRRDFSAGTAWLWLPGLAFAGDFWTWHWSFEHTSVANATLLANTAILWVTLFAWLVWKEKLNRVFLGGAVTAFGGMIVLMLSSTTRIPPTDGNPVFGDFLALLTAGFYAVYQLSIKRFRGQHSAPVLMFWASAVAALVLLPIAWFDSDPFWPGSSTVWLYLIALAVVSHVCGQGLIAWSMGGLPASLASTSLLVQPVTTALLGVFILGQSLVPWQIAGAAIVVIGLFFAIRGQLTGKSSPP